MNALKKKAIIKSSIAPVMSAAENSTLSDEGLHGMIIDILSDAGNGWFFVNMPYNYNGYIHEKNLSFDNDIITSFQKSSEHIIMGYSADILQIPKIQGTRLFNLTRGCQVIRLSEDKNGFSMIKLANGTCGYVRSSFLSIKSKTIKSTKNKASDDIDESDLRSSLLKTAELYIGTPYRWGGKTAMGIDCSGLCSMAYMLNGINIYRDAVIKEGFPIQEISKDKIDIGDLIFFPNHVAMFAGNDKYIHSSLSNDGVYYNSLNKDDAEYREDLASSITTYGSIFESIPKIMKF